MTRKKNNEPVGKITRCDSGFLGAVGTNIPSLYHFISGSEKKYEGLILFEYTQFFLRRPFSPKFQTPVKIFDKLTQKVLVLTQKLWIFFTDFFSKIAKLLLVV